MGHELSQSVVANYTFTLNAASNSLENFGIKVSVSTIRRDSQRPVDAPLPKSGPLMFFLKEAGLNMDNAVVLMQLLKSFVTRHDVMAMANSVQKGTPTANRFKNEAVSAGWYQAWIS